jgi:uncharacterized protein YceK
MRNSVLTVITILLLSGCVPMMPMGTPAAGAAAPQGITAGNCAKYRAQLISVGATPDVADMQARGVGCP